MPTKRKIAAELVRDELWQIVDEYDLPVDDRRKLDDLQAAVCRLSKPALREVLLGFDRDRLKALCRGLGLDDGGKRKDTIVDRLVVVRNDGDDDESDAETSPTGGAEHGRNQDGHRVDDIDRSKDGRNVSPGDSLTGTVYNPKQARPRLFIGSTVEAIQIAREVQVELDYEIQATIWSQNLFTPGDSTWSQLVDMARSQFDFALFVFSGDDIIEARGTATRAPRDNVLLEYGLFVGAVGPERTFFLFNRDRRPKIASDLAGVTALEYGDRDDGNLQAAVAPACTRLIRQCKTLGRLATHAAARARVAPAG